VGTCVYVRLQQPIVQSEQPCRHRYIKPGLASIDHLRITIGAEHCQPGELRDLPCPMDKCLRDVISGITLIEFPVLTVHIA
jgi:hypothetical protein